MELKKQIEEILNQTLIEVINFRQDKHTYSEKIEFLKEKNAEILKLIEDNYVRKDNHKELVKALQKIVLDSAEKDFERVIEMVKEVKKLS